MPEAQDQDALDATVAIHRMSDLVTPMAVRVAATLRLADHLAGGPRSPEALADATGANAVALERLLAHLSTAGVLERVDGGYALTGLGAALRSDDPSRLRDVLTVDGPLGRAELAFIHLLQSVRTGAAGFPEQYGADFWADLLVDPDRSAAYDADMGRDVAAWSPAIVGAYDWAARGHVVDVGGGQGVLLAALLAANPELRGTVFDQPDTAARARAHLDAAGIGDRAATVGGSFFDRLPEGAGAYVLTAIVHDWPDDAAVAILRGGAEAARADGRVIVIEKIGRDGVTPGTEMDLRLLVLMGGRERTVEQLVALGAAAGLREVAVHRAGAIVLLEMTPA
jgi:hypothetical protein